MLLKTGTTWTNAPGLSGISGMGLDVPVDTSIIGRAKAALAQANTLGCAYPLTLAGGIVPTINYAYWTDYCKWNREHADLLQAQSEGKLDLTGVTLPPPPAAPDPNDPRLKLPYAGDSLDEELMAQSRDKTRSWLNSWFDAIGQDPGYGQPDPAKTETTPGWVWLALGGAAVYMLAKR